jgi:hypothetical protein
MSSDNLSGAGNQQERPSSELWLDALSGDLGNWVAGFVDGEGSFNVPIRLLRSGVLPFRSSSRVQSVESSEAIRRAPSRSRGMKIWSKLHSDMREMPFEL